MKGLTEQLAVSIATANVCLMLNDAISGVVHMAFIDTVGVMLAGRDEPVTRAARKFVEAKQSSLQEAGVLFEPKRSSTRDAAFINGIAAHALDYDDVGLMGHPSAVLVPALLAEGEHRHASGLDLMRAYVVGFEVWAELISRDKDSHHIKGWHPTGVFGIVAAAAAVAALRGLDAPRIQHALGIAASMAGGLIANFGSMSKPFHAGQAAAGGIDAVDLALCGLTAATDAIEHDAGYLAALSPQGRVDRAPMTTDLWQNLRIVSSGLTIKKYAMCFATHRVIDAMLDLTHAHDVLPDQVRAVRATVGVTQASMLRNHAPTTGLEAKFSLEFAIAASLIARKIGLTELTDGFVSRPDVQALFSRVQIQTTDTVCPTEPTLAASDRVEIELLDGTIFDSGEIHQTRGAMGFALSIQDLKAKFMDCVAVNDAIKTAALYDQLVAFPELRDVSSLIALCI